LVRDTQIFLQHGVAEVENSLHAKTHLDSSSRFDIDLRRTRGRTGGHTIAANTELAYRRAVKMKTNGQQLMARWKDSGYN